MKNEFGEKITEEEIKNITDKIINLSEDKIDEFWFKCGWIDSEKGENKSLPDWRIKKIKEDYETAKKSVENLMLESRKKEVIKNLNQIKI